MKGYILILLVGISSNLKAQTDRYAKDAESISAVIHTLYDVISGASGQERDWARFRNLFKPESRLLPTSKNKEGEFGLRAISPEEYVQLFSNNVKTGFFETELHHEIEEYGTIAHVFSTYETKEIKDGPAVNRGINSIQLFKDNERYYIISVFWCAESMGFPIPDNYLN